jgi:hypothetical protein
MSIFHLPQVRSVCVKSTVSEVDVYINQSLLEYMGKLKYIPSEVYSKLGNVCDMKEPSIFFKFIEVFHTFPFESKPLHLKYINSEIAKKAFSMVRRENGRLDVHTDVAVEQADVSVGTVEPGSNFYEIVRTVLSRQKLGGHMVVHIPELFSLSTVQLLYLLCSCFTSVCVYAPMLYSGQTKFIVCLNMTKNMEIPIAPPYNFLIPQLFLVKITEINTMIGQKRLEQMRFNMNCDYECLIWKSKYLNLNHHLALPLVRNNMDEDPNRRVDQIN